MQNDSTKNNSDRRIKMANDLFGGLMKGLSGFMPQDDPDVKLMSAQSDSATASKRSTLSCVTAMPVRM